MTLLGQNTPPATDDQLCRCGSGLPYRSCHLDLDRAPAQERVSVSQRMYAAAWGANAAHLDSQGIYAWMAAQLGKVVPQRVLDIGCGAGQGIAALLRAYQCQVVSIDENLACLRATQSHLTAAGHDVTLCTRLRFQPVAERRHLVKVEPHRLRIGQQVTLIEADWLDHDPELFGFLEELPRFDVVTMWLSGTHGCHAECVLNGSIPTPSSPYENRLSAQRKVYQTATRWLRLGGLVQIVDRGVPITAEVRRWWWQHHLEMASTAGFEPCKIADRPYREPTAPSHLRVSADVNPTALSVRVTGGSLVSVLARKG